MFPDSSFGRAGFWFGGDPLSKIRKNHSESNRSWVFSSGLTTVTALALAELLGAPVYDPSGAAGRVREVALAPQEDRSRVTSLIVKTRTGQRLLPFSAILAINGGVRTSTGAAEWPSENGS